MNGPATDSSAANVPRTASTFVGFIAWASWVPSSIAPELPQITSAPSIVAPSTWSRWLWVSTHAAIPPRRSPSARIASMWPSSAGPGSITQAGFEPTM